MDHPCNPPEGSARRVCPSPRTRIFRRVASILAVAGAGVGLVAGSPAGAQGPRARRVDRAELVRLATPALARTMTPCELRDVEAPRAARLPRGPLTVRGDGHAPPRSGRVALAVGVVFEGETHAVRVPLRVRLTCPEPVVRPGAQVRVVAVVGAVRASAPGEVRQVGRVGDVIVVVNQATDASLRARVVDANTVEVVR